MGILAKRVGSLAVVSVSFVSVHQMIHGNKSLPFKVLFFTLFGRKQVMLANDACSSWHNKIGGFFFCWTVWDRRKESLIQR